MEPIKIFNNFTIQPIKPIKDSTKKPSGIYSSKSASKAGSQASSVKASNKNIAIINEKEKEKIDVKTDDKPKFEPIQDIKDIKETPVTVNKEVETNLNSETIHTDKDNQEDETKEQKDYFMLENHVFDAQVSKDSIYLCKRNHFYIIQEKILVDNLESHLIYSHDKLPPFSFMKDQKNFGFNKNNTLKTPSPKYLLEEDFQLVPARIIYSNFFEGSKITDKEGLMATDPHLLVRFRGIVSDMISQLLKRLIGGPPVSLNVKIFEPRSSLHRNSDMFSYAPMYLHKASDANLSPIDRMKLVCTFGISGLILSCKQIKPFNPLIGETFEGELPDGSQVYAEHIGHYPTLSRFLILGKDNNFRVYCCLDLEAKTESFGSRIIVIQRGVITVEFPKINEKIHYKIPLMKLENCTSEKDRYCYMYDYFEAYDLKNKLKTMVQFGYNKKSITSFIGAICIYDKVKNMDALSSSQEKKHTEKYMEVIVKNREYLDNLEAKKLSFFKTENLPSSILEGTFVKQMTIDKKLMWDFEVDEAPYIKPKEKVLPSDTRYREDLIWLYYALYYSQTKKEYEKFMGYSQAWKVETEYIQRKERGIRADYKKKINKK